MYRESCIPIFIADINTDAKTDRSRTREQLFCKCLYNTNYLSLNKLDSCKGILDDDALNVSRHRPIVTPLEFATNSKSDTRLKVVETVSKINWKGIKECDNVNYVSAIIENNELLRLEHCELNRSNIDIAYTTIIKAITESSSCLPVSK
jgi:hypothetical protein